MAAPLGWIAGIEDAPGVERRHGVRGRHRLPRVGMVDDKATARARHQVLCDAVPQLLRSRERQLLLKLSELPLYLLYLPLALPDVSLDRAREDGLQRDSFGVVQDGRLRRQHRRLRPLPVRLQSSHILGQLLDLSHGSVRLGVQALRSYCAIEPLAVQIVGEGGG